MSTPTTPPFERQYRRTGRDVLARNPDVSRRHGREVAKRMTQEMADVGPLLADVIE